MTRSRVLGVGGVAVVLGVAAYFGPELIAHWRADRTAKQFATAVFDADSVQIAKLTQSGSGHNVLCVRRMWPAAFWMKRDGTPLKVLASRPKDGAYGYRTIGDSLPHNNGPAIFEFYIAPDTPTKVRSIFTDFRTGVWTDTVRACLRP